MERHEGPRDERENEHLWMNIDGTKDIIHQKTLIQQDVKAKFQDIKD